MKFVCDDKGRVLLELQMDLSGPVAQWLKSQEFVPEQPEQEVRGGDLQLKDGVWID